MNGTVKFIFLEETMDKKKYLEEINRVIEVGPFHDTWESLSGYQCPEWYRKAKFGIFIHWGIYSVPAFENEWYSRNMYVQGGGAYEHHIKTYGEHKDFGYKDFIPMFTADRFDEDEWAELFKMAGAKYVIPVAEHHDGFQMYKSDISKWNAYEMGPKKDILGKLKAAVEKRDITLGASSHRVEHWFFMGHGKDFDSDIKEPMVCGDFYWPAQPEYDHFDAFSPSPSQEFLEDWLMRTCEIVDNYRPKVIYFDWWIIHNAVKPYLRKFAAYYYNRAHEWGEEVAINYKDDSFQFGCAVVDIERGQFAEAKPYFWQTCTSVAKNSWGFTENNDYKSVREILCDLVDIVSKNGTLLLNIGPKSDGSIPEEDKNILLEIGEWLKVNGEAIYDSNVWKVSAEGPTKIVEGGFSDGITKTFTSQDIRFTTKGSYLYATVLNYPENGEVVIKSLGHRIFRGIVKEVSVLGYEEQVDWNMTEEALEIKTNRVSSDKPVVFKILMN